MGEGSYLLPNAPGKGLTFQEWHYFVAGLALGTIAGWILGAEYSRQHFHGGDG
jgi:hypothetical protein